MSSNGGSGANKYGFYPMLDLEKLSIILTIENANMLRINPELLVSGSVQDGEQSSSDDGRLDWLMNQARQFPLKIATCFTKYYGLV